MASRQQQKEARRRARLEQEAQERRQAARQKRLQLVMGGVLAAGIVAAVVVVIAGGGGDGGASASGAQTASSSASLPAQQTADLQEAVQASGCTLTHPAEEGRGHDSRQFTAADYKTNPPTSGTHYPEWAQDGVYQPGNTPDLGQLVHTLEHGRINVQYKPGTNPELVSKLEAFVAENEGYHMLLYENPTGMQAQVAATTWTLCLTCDADPTGDPMWYALRAFRDRYIDTGPERVP
jgi:hypothetical protein